MPGSAVAIQVLQIGFGGQQAKEGRPVGPALRDAAPTFGFSLAFAARRTSLVRHMEPTLL